ncbi:MAG TPA: YciI family protein [Longimicrobiaceae bacterium]|jgi:uncharacterized protein YciI|nr:YciI family protein [Longimicrobiaceae bacterium]
MFIVLLNYVKPIADVEAHTPAHRAYLDRHYASGRLICSGPRVPRTGGVLLARGDDEAELRALLADDPFQVHGIAEYELIRFQPGKHDPAFAPFLAPLA